MSLLLESLDQQSDDEEIRRLFPKCKPLKDNNTSIVVSSFHLTDANLNNIHQVVDRNENCLVVEMADNNDTGSDHSINRNRKLLDSDVNHHISLIAANICKDSMKVDHSVVSGYEQVEGSDNQLGRKVKGDGNDVTPRDTDSEHSGYGSRHRGTDYKLRDSRIEIAGGREVFSQSRSKAMRKRGDDTSGGRVRKVVTPVLVNSCCSNDTDLPTVKRRDISENKLIRSEDRLTKTDERLFRNEDKLLKNEDVKIDDKPCKGDDQVLKNDDKLSRTDNLLLKSSEKLFKDEDIKFLRGEDKPAKSEDKPVKSEEKPVKIEDKPVKSDAWDPWLKKDLYNEKRAYFDTVTAQFHHSDSIGSSTPPTPVGSAPFCSVEVHSVPDNLPTCPVVYEADISGNSEVVFDDIGDWLAQCKAYQHQEPTVVKGNDGTINRRQSKEDGSMCDSMSSRDSESPSTASRLSRTLSLSESLCDKTSPPEKEADAPTATRGLRVIGNVPIAEYEGSPRRYGPRPPAAIPTSSPEEPPGHNRVSPNRPPRPGFPQRVFPVDENTKTETTLTVQTVSPQPLLDAMCTGSGEDSDTSISPTLGKETSFLGDAFDSDELSFAYEISETRKVLEEFFKSSNRTEMDFSELEYKLYRHAGNSYVGQRLAKGFLEDSAEAEESPKKPNRHAATSSHSLLVSPTECRPTDVRDLISLNALDTRDSFLDLSGDNDHSVSTNPETEDLGETEVGLQVGHSRNFTLSPETTDCDSNDIESELSVDNEGSVHSSARLYSSMPVLEDGLSSGHASEVEEPLNDLQINEESDIVLVSNMIYKHNNRSQTHPTSELNPTMVLMKKQISEIEKEIKLRSQKQLTMISPGNSADQLRKLDLKEVEDFLLNDPTASFESNDSTLEILDPVIRIQTTPPPPAPHAHRNDVIMDDDEGVDTQTDLESLPNSENPPIPSAAVEAAIKDIKLAIQRTKTLPKSTTNGTDVPENEDGVENKPVWVPRQSINGRTTENGESIKREDGHPEEEEADTDQETDRLLGQHRPDDQGFFDEKQQWRKPKSRTLLPPSNKNNVKQPTTAVAAAATAPRSPSITASANDDGVPSETSSPPKEQNSNGKVKKEMGKKKGRNKEVLIEGVLFRAQYLGSTQLVCEGQPTKSTRMMQAEEAVSRIKANQNGGSQQGYNDDDDDGIDDDDNDDDDDIELELGSDPTLIDPMLTPILPQPPPPPVPLLGSGTSGTVYRLRFLGSVEVEEESTGKRRRKRLKKTMVEEAVAKIKALAPDGESQPSTEVDLFISTEKIMVLNTDLKEIMMDHALRTISYIADIGELVVLMARRRIVPQDGEEEMKISRTPKMICHVFESEEAQFIAQSIGQAFQVAYMEFLKANGIEDHSFVKEMDYQEVLNSQEIFGDELQMFAKKEMQKEVVVPKAKGEILGVVIVESGWGSMLPTVVIANLAPAGAAARCGQLNIGDQIIAINGISLVGLPLCTCQAYIKNTKYQTVVKLTVVPCAPVVEVKIKRPDTKYQLGFSVQNGVICSLLRGGIAERGGVRVGHRIIEINNQSVVAVPHEKIVNLLATSVGEILMKTMPTSMFRLLTGQETPVYI